jgi:hypothetical protein
MNAVKAVFISKYLPKRSVLDLGIGRGQDIKKYTFAGVNRVIGVDGDINALQELVYRRTELIPAGQKTKRVCRVNVYVADL